MDFECGDDFDLESCCGQHQHHHHHHHPSCQHHHHHHNCNQHRNREDEEEPCFCQPKKTKKHLKLLVGVTASVATIKLEELVDKLYSIPGVQEIAVVPTEKSEKFFNADEIASIGRNHEKAEVKVWKDEDEWSMWNERGDPVLHIDLGKWADAMIIAPLDANSLAKIATGLCDNLLTCVLRAWDLKNVKKKPVFFCPAMNTKMWEHPITAQQIQALINFGYTCIPPIEKTLMCGDTGIGAMATVNTIVSTVRNRLNMICSCDGQDDAFSSGSKISSGTKSYASTTSSSYTANRHQSGNCNSIFQSYNACAEVLCEDDDELQEQGQDDSAQRHMQQQNKGQGSEQKKGQQGHQNLGGAKGNRGKQGQQQQGTGSKISTNSMSSDSHRGGQQQKQVSGSKINGTSSTSSSHHGGGQQQPQVSGSEINENTVSSYSHAGSGRSIGQTQQQQLSESKISESMSSYSRAGTSSAASSLINTQQRQVSGRTSGAGSSVIGTHQQQVSARTSGAGSSVIDTHPQQVSGRTSGAGSSVIDTHPQQVSGRMSGAGSSVIDTHQQQVSARTSGAGSSVIDTHQQQVSGSKMIENPMSSTGAAKSILETVVSSITKEDIRQDEGQDVSAEPNIEERMDQQGLESEIPENSISSYSHPDASSTGKSMVKTEVSTNSSQFGAVTFNSISSVNSHDVTDLNLGASRSQTPTTKTSSVPASQKSSSNHPSASTSTDDLKD